MTVDTNEFAVQGDSILLDKITSFKWLKSEWLDEHVKLDKFIDVIDVDRWTFFKNLAEPGDEFYEWDWTAGPLCGRGGVCIFRNNRPIYAYGIWMS